MRETFGCFGRLVKTSCALIDVDVERGRREEPQSREAGAVAHALGAAYVVIQFMASADSSDQKILDSFFEFISIHEWDAIERYLARNPHLLTRRAEALITWAAGEIPDEAVQRKVLQAVEFLRRVRESGFEAVLREQEGPRVALQAFFEAESQTAKFEIARANPELLDPSIDAELAQIRDEQPDPESRRIVEETAALLREFRRMIAEGEEGPAEDPEADFAEAMRLRMRYDERGQWDDLEQSIVLMARACDALPESAPKFPIILSLLGSTLRLRYLRTTDLEDLERAIACLERSVALSDDAPILVNYTTGLLERFKRTSELDDLDLLIELCQRALPDMPGESGWSALNNLGIGLRQRYLRTGVLPDLDRALAAWEEALPRVRGGSNERRLLPPVLTNLSTGYFDRFNRTGALADLDACVRVSKEAIETAHPNSPDQPMYHYNLGGQLMQRFNLLKNADDLREAIEVHQHAVTTAREGAAEQSMFLDGWGNALIQLYGDSGDPELLTAAIEAHERAVALTPLQSAVRPRHVGHLSHALEQRFRHSGDPADDDRAMSLMEEAVTIAPRNMPERLRHLLSLAQSIVRRWTRSNSDEDLARGRELCEAAARESLDIDSSTSLLAAVNWGRWAFHRAAWSEVAEAHDLVVEARERLTSMQVDRQASGAWLGLVQGFTAEAAFALAQLGDARRAVMAIELGRARLLTDALERDRADLGRLESSHLELTARYREAADRARFVDVTRLGGDDPYAVARAARRELDEAIKAIRGVETYENFLRPPAWDEILRIITAQVADSAVVYLMTTTLGSLALIAAAFQEIEIVWSDLRRSHLAELLVKRTDDVVTGGFLPGQFESRTDWLETALDELLPRIGETLIAPLAVRLGRRGVTRVTLVPLGDLALVPLHAARFDGRQLLDEMTVSYAPGMRPLGVAQRLAAARGEKKRFVGVANPAPHPAPLHGAEAEVRQIEKYFDAENAVTLYGTAVTRQRVLEAIGDATHIHFACHGYFDPRDNLDSRLELGCGEVLTLRDLLDRTARPQNARLAVLSACQTALIDFQDLPDEVVGISAGFLEAGVPGVVGSLWSVNDFSTALVMVCFYEHLVQESRNPADALRAAQLWLRDATAADLMAYVDARPVLFEALRQSLGRGDRGVLTAMATMPNDAQPFAARPYHWASFVYSGA